MAKRRCAVCASASRKAENVASYLIFTAPFRMVCRCFTCIMGRKIWTPCSGEVELCEHAVNPAKLLAFDLPSPPMCQRAKDSVQDGVQVKGQIGGEKSQHKIAVLL